MKAKRQVMTRNHNRASQDRVFFVAVLVMIAIGFYWRLIYLQRISLHIDEFTTILAAQMIVQKGIPQLPSGLFYDTGLLFSYVVAAFIGSVGFSEAVARFPSILFSLLSVAVTFRLGKRFFSPAVALAGLSPVSSGTRSSEVGGAITTLCPVTVLGNSRDMGHGRGGHPPVARALARPFLAGNDGGIAVASSWRSVDAVLVGSGPAG